MKNFIFLSFLILFSINTFGGPSDEQIVQQIITESIMSYPGKCACPYNTTSNGRSCGKRSAYSKPGGYSPICYPRDVTNDMIENYKRSHNLK